MGGFAPSLNGWPGNQGTVSRRLGRVGRGRHTARTVGAMAAGEDRPYTHGDSRSCPAAASVESPGVIPSRQPCGRKRRRAGCACWALGRQPDGAEVPFDSAMHCRRRSAPAAHAKICRSGRVVRQRTCNPPYAGPTPVSGSTVSRPGRAAVVTRPRFGRGCGPSR